MKKTARPKLPTIAEAREIIEKTGLVHLSMIQDDDNTIRVLPENIIAALRGMNKAEDQVIFPMLGIAVPAYYLLKFAPLMGEYAATMRVNRNTMELTIEYKATPDSKSRTTIIGWDATCFDRPEAPRPEFTARVTTDKIETAVKIDTWIRKAVSKDDARPEMMKDYGQFSADGYRLHYDRRLPLNIPHDPNGYTSPERFDAIPAKVADVLHTASHVDNAALVNVDEFLTAMKRALKANKDRATLSVNGRFDVLSSVFNCTGDPTDVTSVSSQLTEGYQHNGDNVTLDIDPRFVVDALAGMTGEVVIGISELTGNGGRMFYVSDGTREAVIMSKKS